jgi:hypothetical protein
VNVRVLLSEPWSLQVETIGEAGLAPRIVARAGPLAASDREAGSLPLGLRPVGAVGGCS